jgi:hypothetical protein
MSDPTDEAAHSIVRVIYTHGGCTLMTNDADITLGRIAAVTDVAIGYWISVNGGTIHTVLIAEDVRHLSHNDRINHATILRTFSRAAAAGRRMGSIMPAKVTA